MKYGWEFSNGLLVPKLTDNLTSPLPVVGLTSWGYKKECVSSRCFKNCLVSTDQRKCTLCKNGRNDAESDNE